MRIAPVSSAMISSARSRDPRLMRQQATISTAGQAQRQDPRVVPSSILQQSGGSVLKTLGRIPKLNQSNNHNRASRDNDMRNRDPRNRRHKEESSSGSKSKNSLSSKDKSKSSPSSKSPSSRSNERKKSGSSDDSSPRKKIEDEKKFSKSPSSHHRIAHSSLPKSPAKSAGSEDIDLRMVSVSENNMKPDSTTNHSKSNKDKLLNDLLNVEDMKSIHELKASDDNGKENKPILVVTINIQRFIVAML